jgi:hypothetical protein
LELSPNEWQVEPYTGTPTATSVCEVLFWKKDVRGNPSDVHYVLYVELMKWLAKRTKGMPCIMYKHVRDGDSDGAKEKDAEKELPIPAQGPAAKKQKQKQTRGTKDTTEKGQGETKSSADDVVEGKRVKKPTRTAEFEY